MVNLCGYDAVSSQHGEDAMPPRSRKKEKLFEKLPVEVRKHVAAIHVVGELGLVERRLINVLLLNAAEKMCEDNRTHSLPVSALMDIMGWEKSKNEDYLKEALKKLSSTPIVFNRLQDGKQEWETMAPLSWAKIADGICSYRYDQALSRKLADPDMYAVINVNIQNALKSEFALALYENCFRFHRVGSTGVLDLEVWRELLGARSGSYDEYKFLSHFVLKPAIKAVNDVSNITVEMIPVKEGRRVVALKFSVALKAQASLIDSVLMSDSEIQESEAFALLRKCRIGIHLAMDMVRRDPAKALQVARDTLTRTTVKNHAAYATAVFKNANVTDVESAEKKEPVQGSTESDADSQSDIQRGTWNQLSDGEMAMLAEEFIAQTGAATRVSGKYDFRDVNEKVAWSHFRGVRAAQVIAAR